MSIADALHDALARLRGETADPFRREAPPRLDVPDGGYRRGDYVFRRSPLTGELIGWYDPLPKEPPK